VADMNDRLASFGVTDLNSEYTSKVYFASIKHLNSVSQLINYNLS